MTNIHDKVYEYSTIYADLEKLKSYIESVNYNCTGRGNVIKKCVLNTQEDIALYLMKLRPWDKTSQRDFFERFVTRGYLSCIDYVVSELEYDIIEFKVFKSRIGSRYRFFKNFLPNSAKNLIKSFVHLHKLGYITSVELLLDDRTEFINDVLMGVDVET